MKPLTLNLRTDDGQAGLIPGMEGQPLKSKPAPRVERAADLWEDRPTATRTVPIVIVTDETQGDLF